MAFKKKEKFSIKYHLSLYATRINEEKSEEDVDISEITSYQKLKEKKIYNNKTDKPTQVL